MASVFQRDGGYVVKWRDAAGRWRMHRTTCETKLEAKRLGADLERQAFPLNETAADRTIVIT